MKPKPTLPKGRLVWVTPDFAYWGKDRIETDSLPAAIIWCRSAKQARAILKLHNTPREELVGRVAVRILKLRERGFMSCKELADAAVKEILP